MHVLQILKGANAVPSHDTQDTNIREREAVHGPLFLFLSFKTLLVLGRACPLLATRRVQTMRQLST